MFYCTGTLDVHFTYHNNTCTHQSPQMYMYCMVQTKRKVYSEKYRQIHYTTYIHIHTNTTILRVSVVKISCLPLLITVWCHLYCLRLLNYWAPVLRTCFILKPAWFPSELRLYIVQICPSSVLYSRQYKYTPKNSCEPYSRYSCTAVHVPVHS